MKKQQKANLIMVLIIAVIAAIGVFAATQLLKPEEIPFGTEYKIAQIPDNYLKIEGEVKDICTITIRCDTIFDNADNLEQAKIPYVPENGEILPVTTVEFIPGETVFEVLNRVCKTAGLQIEYSWTPMYDSYYIEGINHLYEFDCGFESGWMYKVNGWFPNYGCSAYELQGGEEIVWCYTCTGLGTDVGAEREDLK